MEKIEKQHPYKKFMEDMSNVFIGNVEKEDKQLPKDIINLLIDHGMKEISIRISQQLFFSSVYSSQKNEFKIKKYFQLVHYLGEHQNSDLFFRYIYLIRQKNLESAKLKLDQLIHSLISLSLKQKQLYDADESTIVKDGNHEINISFNIPMGLPLHPTQQMQDLLKSQNPKGFISNLHGKLNQNPAYFQEKSSGTSFESRCEFTILKNNKKKFNQETFKGTGAGPSKNDAEANAAKDLLVKIWHKYPQTKKMG